MAKIEVHLAAQEYYTGQTEVDLPEGITEDHIENVEPDGYGEFCIHLNDEGLEKIMLQVADQGLEWKEWGEWSKLEYMELDFDWSLYRYGPNVPWLKFRGEIPMEFAEVEENLVEHWEVEDNG